MTVKCDGSVYHIDVDYRQKHHKHFAILNTTLSYAREADQYVSIVGFCCCCFLYKICPRFRWDNNNGLHLGTFSKFYRRYYDLISKFQVGLKSLLRQGLSEPDFYGDLMYKLKKIVGSNNFSAQFIKIISHYKKIGYNINVLQQTACLVVNPITVGNFAFLFNCTPVGRTSDSMMVPT